MLPLIAETISNLDLEGNFIAVYAKLEKLNLMGLQNILMRRVASAMPTVARRKTI